MMNRALNMADETIVAILPLVPENKEMLKALEEQFLHEQLRQVNARIERHEARQADRSPAEDVPRGDALVLQLYLQQATLLRALQREVQNRPLVAAIRDRLTFAYQHNWHSYVLCQDAGHRQERWHVRAEKDILVRLLQDWEHWLSAYSDTHKEA